MMIHPTPSYSRYAQAPSPSIVFGNKAGLAHDVNGGIEKLCLVQNRLRGALTSNRIGTASHDRLMAITQGDNVETALKHPEIALWGGTNNEHFERFKQWLVTYGSEEDKQLMLNAVLIEAMTA